jgi:hypothetical protein
MEDQRMPSSRLDNCSQGMARRTFLLRTSSISALAILAGIGLPASAFGASSAGDFMTLSEFLTGHKLNPVIGARFLAALKADDPGFDANLANLIQAVSAARPTDMDGFLAKQDSGSPLVATARTIVSAWYLGTVGKGEKAVLVSFKEALMFEVTKNYIYVPSYGGGPDSWVPTPPFIQG